MTGPLIGLSTLNYQRTGGQPPNPKPPKRRTAMYIGIGTVLLIILIILLIILL